MNKKIFGYFLLFFIGSLLPFLIIEFYFQDFIAIGIIIIITCIVLTLCILFEYLKVKVVSLLDVQKKEIDYFNWMHKKEKPERISFFFFRKNLW